MSDDALLKLAFAAAIAIVVVLFAVSRLATSLITNGWHRGRLDWVRRGEQLGAILGRELFTSISLVNALVSADQSSVRRLLDELSRARGASALNARIASLTWLGRYREAVRLYARHGRVIQPASDRLLLRVNVAEALYNLGQWKRARQLMDATLSDPSRLGEQRWLESGLRAQRAWIAAHDGDAARGRELMRDLTEDGFLDDYVAELHFTRAALELAAKDAGAAEKHLRDARKVLRRKSSERNLLFLEARLAVLKGDRDRAIDLCRQASEHPYRGQGGDGLLLWGDLLAERGDVDGARNAWRLATERDPESESARIASRRLG